MNIVLKRTGALGDVIQTTPIARRLRKENPFDIIDVQTQHVWAYLDNPDVNIVARENVTTCESVDRIIDLDHVYERRADIHAIDAYMLAAFGDNGQQHSKSVFLAHGKSHPWIDHKTILFHPNTSWPNRTLPRRFWGSLALRLQRSGFRVAEIGTQIDIDLTEFGVIDTRNLLSLADQVQAIEDSGCLVCGDSSMFTVVGATDTPAVGFCTISKPEVFAPWRHDEFMWNFTALRANVDCFGCREHAGDVTYLDCRFGTNACVDAFDLDETFETILSAIQNDRRKR